MKRETTANSLGLEELQFETSAIHQGTSYCEQSGAVTPPIYMSSTFEFGNELGFDYTRSGNPNFRNLAETLATLEQGRFATVFSSGVAAITAVISSLSAGDSILAEENVYGCTYRLFEQVLRKFGVKISYLDFSNPENYQEICKQKPKLVWLESPTNPLLKILDIEALSQQAQLCGATLIVDNTFASPALQTPLTLGATLSLSSTTKYINGHSDCLGGVVVTNSEEWQERLIFAQKALGLNPSPFDTWLVQRGVKTLGLRAAKHSENALALARFLESSGKTTLVRYPYLESHPQYELAKKQMRGGSGIVVADFGRTREETISRLQKLRLFTLAESLGGVESLVCHPASMTHASVPRTVREKVGISDSLVRFSVGIECVDDLRADLERVFKD